MAAAENFRLHFLNNRSSIQSFFEISASNTNIATSQARHLHRFQSQGNFWNRLTNALCSWKKSVRNFGNITCEFQTVGYLVFLKPYPVAGCVDTGYRNVWIFQRGVVFHAERVRNVRLGSFRRFPESQQIDTYNPYISGAIKIYGQFFNQYIYLTISYTYVIFYP